MGVVTSYLDGRRAYTGLQRARDIVLAREITKEEQ